MNGCHVVLLLKPSAAKIPSRCSCSTDISKQLLLVRIFSLGKMGIFCKCFRPWSIILVPITIANKRSLEHHHVLVAVAGRVKAIRAFHPKRIFFFELVLVLQKTT